MAIVVFITDTELRAGWSMMATIQKLGHWTGDILIRKLENLCPMYVDIFPENFTTYMAIWKEIKFNVLTDFIAFWQRKNFILCSNSNETIFICFIRSRIQHVKSYLGWRSSFLLLLIKPEPF